ncbi:hypothetical protein U8C32_26685 (plasmid) [Sinorhizobium medicae]|uniref:hypothetical protein n=1 Tax=Sinorhizobium medicae TaxID=110321 RepID=UPI002AF6BCA6|nr:hypothetical protein [Sinorhizobium medicae]WQO48318.1 hypothetical protein U8C42_26940 [Sinorhizobium medicae]WQO68733.1 hypothetical protein U8C40_28195 [Sinorhizobium medicae]WQO75770.1 hypothetical protein U8C31_27730 [Sinorhizobium medicae]WQO94935.1 hypothetical protein U8C32_26685 [Sinorhizobium medicae]
MIMSWRTTAPTPKKPDVKFEARPKKQPTDYRARTKELMKRYPKVTEYLAK